MVLMSGDPIRIKYVAENYLDDVVQINNTRLMLAYTGFYKNKKISLMSHGIGMPSASLYVRELITEYNVDTIIRMGTCGAVDADIKLRDILISMAASTDSNMNRINFRGYDLASIANFNMICKVTNVAKKMNINIRVGNFFTTDSFYHKDIKLLDILKRYNILGIDMETAGIYSIASELRAQALSICTVSDHIIKQEKLSVKERESSFNEMIKIVLETVFLYF
ncbi:MAG: purine-nucleoside phosphorylase [Buchnera aphidicola]|nr:purine-nucleoside phosphorylase [Buchnera aphidicola]